jgi:hypothetical protein
VLLVHLNVEQSMHYFFIHSRYTFYMLLWHTWVPKVMPYTVTIEFPLSALLQCLYSVLNPFVKQVRSPFPMTLKLTFQFTADWLDCSGYFVK